MTVRHGENCDIFAIFRNEILRLFVFSGFLQHTITYTYIPYREFRSVGAFFCHSFRSYLFFFFVVAFHMLTVTFDSGLRGLSQRWALIADGVHINAKPERDSQSGLRAQRFVNNSHMAHQTNIIDQPIRHTPPFGMTIWRSGLVCQRRGYRYRYIYVQGKYVCIVYPGAMDNNMNHEKKKRKINLYGKPFFMYGKAVRRTQMIAFSTGLLSVGRSFLCLCVCWLGENVRTDITQQAQCVSQTK